MQQQSALLKPKPYTIKAKTTKTFQLLLPALRGQGMDADAVRVQVVNGRGRVLHERDITL